MAGVLVGVTVDVSVGVGVSVATCVCDGVSVDGGVVLGDGEGMEEETAIGVGVHSSPRNVTDKGWQAPPCSGGTKIGCVITTSIPHDRAGRGGNGPRVQSVRVPKDSGDCMRGESA